MPTQSAAGEVLAIAIHPVADYATWRAVYDAGKDLRDRMGLTGGEVFVDPKDPNKVIVLARFASLAAMETFTRHPGLGASMKKAGVIEPRSIFVGIRA
jgi:hypothetical protein